MLPSEGEHVQLLEKIIEPTELIDDRVDVPCQIDVPHELESDTSISLIEAKALDIASDLARIQIDKHNGNFYLTKNGRAKLKCLAQELHVVYDTVLSRVNKIGLGDNKDFSSEDLLRVKEDFEANPVKPTIHKLAALALRYDVTIGLLRFAMKDLGVKDLENLRAEDIELLQELRRQSPKRGRPRKNLHL